MLTISMPPGSILKETAGARPCSAHKNMFFVLSYRQGLEGSGTDR